MRVLSCLCFTIEPHEITKWSQTVLTNIFFSISETSKHSGMSCVLRGINYLKRRDITDISYHQVGTIRMKVILLNAYYG